MPSVALLDANVLYPTCLRDLPLRFAQDDVYRPRWSAEILDEVARNLKEGRDDAGRQKVDCMVSFIEEHFEDAEVTGYEVLLPAMTNDPKDRRVLAAAIVGRADVIVTCNFRHFPSHSRETYDIDAQGSDEFLRYQWWQVDPDRLVGVLRRWTDQLHRHPNTLERVLEERLARTVPGFSNVVLEYIRNNET